MAGGLPLLFFIALILVALLANAFGHEAGAPNAEWYRSLKTPNGGSCCSYGTDNDDCFETEYRMRDGAYQATTPDGQWVVIPPEKILIRHDNPTGHGVLCWRPTLGVLCFVAGAEG